MTSSEIRKSPEVDPRRHIPSAEDYARLESDSRFIELRRRFRDSVGYGPKTLQRVLRFQRALAGLRPQHEPADSLAGLAASAGYSDQAHMTREIRALSGLTPVELARSR